MDRKAELGNLVHGGASAVKIIINNSTYPAVKNKNTAYHAFGKY